MQELEIRRLEAIKATLYLLLLAFLAILTGTLVIASRPLVENTDRSAGWCGTVMPYEGPTSAQYDRGKEIFINNCASCHNKNMRDHLTGPALGDVESRWSNFPHQDLYRYIRSSQAMTKSRHPRAIQLWKEWKPAVMNNFPALTDQDIEDLLQYIP